LRVLSRELRRRLLGLSAGPEQGQPPREDRRIPSSEGLGELARGEAGACVLITTTVPAMAQWSLAWGVVGQRGQSRPGQDHLGLLARLRPSEIAFLDIETAGIRDAPVFLVGTLRADGGEWQIIQHLARHYGEEKAVLEQALTHLGRARALVTYNGSAFDLPYLSQRAALHGLAGLPSLFHLDLLPLARRRWADGLGDCRLLTLEARVLGSRRQSPSPSAHLRLARGRRSR